MSWISTADILPPEGQVVLTKIDDSQGPRNQTGLKRHGNLWFLPDGSMYVHYRPTHWQALIAAPYPLFDQRAKLGEG